MSGLPPSVRVVLDASVRGYRAGTVLAGGTPARVMRLTSDGAATVRALLDGQPVSAAGRQLARRLVDAGLAHPRAPRDDGASVTVIVPARDRPARARGLPDGDGARTPGDRRRRRFPRRRRGGRGRSSSRGTTAALRTLRRTGSRTQRRPCGGNDRAHRLRRQRLRAHARMARRTRRSLRRPARGRGGAEGGADPECRVPQPTGALLRRPLAAGHGTAGEPRRSARPRSLRPHRGARRPTPRPGGSVRRAAALRRGRRPRLAPARRRVAHPLRPQQHGPPRRAADLESVAHAPLAVRHLRGGARPAPPGPPAPCHGASAAHRRGGAGALRPPVPGGHRGCAPRRAHRPSPAEHRRSPRAGGRMVDARGRPHVPVMGSREHGTRRAGLAGQPPLAAHASPRSGAARGGAGARMGPAAAAARPAALDRCMHRRRRGLWPGRVVGLPAPPQREAAAAGLRWST